jgi:ubiquinone/menaquinone biosynthesis C-methylase UbiE
MDNKTVQTYNLLAEDYEQKTASYWSRFPNEFLHSFIQQATSPVLDIGCGTGRDGAIFAYHKLEVTCLDASPKMVELCQAKGLYAAVGDMHALPFAEESFNAVWAYTSLLHATKQELSQTLQEIRRVLTKRGVVGIGLIQGTTEGYVSSYKGEATSVERWFSYYTETEAKQALVEHGFSVEVHPPIIDGNRVYMHFLCHKI